MKQALFIFVLLMTFWTGYATFTFDSSSTLYALYPVSFAINLVSLMHAMRNS